MSTAKVTMPPWVATMQKDFSKALKRLENIESQRSKDLEIISDLQRQYQSIVEASAQGAARLEGVSSDEAVTYILHAKLQKLTIKRHAVLTATLGGVGYQELAAITGWDVTTVKLQLRAALQILGIANRQTLLVQHRRLLDAVTDKDYITRYGVSKRWWLEQPADLMDVLRSTKPTANQHVSAAATAKKRRVK